jgi:acetyl esterase
MNPVNLTDRKPQDLLTPAMRQVVANMARTKQPALHQLPPEQARQAYDKGSGVLDVPGPALARVEDLSIPARDGAQLPARLYAPQPVGAGVDGRLPTLLYLHGGGFTIGSIASHEALCRRLAGQAACAVVALDYRRAPEHQFPTAVHDAWDALTWLARPDQAEVLGLDATRLAVGGDSAGGTLAAVCAIQARDAGLKLALQLLFYPGTTAHQDTPSHQTYAEGFVLGAAAIRYFFDHYAPRREDREDWRFAPLLAPDVDGVAPAWIGLAECDPLVDEGLLYADKLRAAGVPVDLDIYRGVTHEFIKMGRAIPEALQAQADAARALRSALFV